MNMNIQTIPRDWGIAYDPYSDLLQIYDQRLHKMKESSLKRKNTRKYSVFYEKKNNEFMMIQVEKTFDKFKADISEMGREKIIELLFTFINNGSKKADKNN